MSLRRISRSPRGTSEEYEKEFDYFVLVFTLSRIQHKVKMNEVNQVLIQMAEQLGLGGPGGYNPGSLTVLMNLITDKGMDIMIPLKAWYAQAKEDSNWTDFFDKSGNGWLWSLFKDHNDKDINKLVEFLTSN